MISDGHLPSHDSSVGVSIRQRCSLSRRNDDPKTASRPFDKDRDGWRSGRAPASFSKSRHARARGAHIYAEIVGYGLSGDAFHITTPSTDGPARCMRMALRHAGIAPGIVAQRTARPRTSATSTK